MELNLTLLICSALAAGFCAGRLWVHSSRGRLLVWVEEPPERGPRPLTMLYHYGAHVVYVHDSRTGALRAIQVGRQ